MKSMAMQKDQIERVPVAPCGGPRRPLIVLQWFKGGTLAWAGWRRYDVDTAQGGRGAGMVGKHPFEQLLQENGLEPRFASPLLNVFLNVCRSLHVSDPADPMSNEIARTVINIALESVRDPEGIFEEALNRFSRDPCAPSASKRQRGS